jgi:hypothetical protein
VNHVVFILTLLATANAMGQTQPARPVNIDVLVEPHHSSTVREGELRGYGAAARGEAKLIEAIGGALVDRETAREQFIMNRRLAFQVYYERKAAYEQWHKQKYASGLPAIAQQEWQRRQLPARLTLAELTAEGQIAWPELLTTEEYGQPRETLAKLLRERATGASREQAAAVRKAIVDETARLQANLKTKIDRYTPADYLAARRFIESLRYEAKSATPLVLVADRR